MKTATITFHCSINYGSVLQAYALQEFLQSSGFENHIIDYVHRPNARQYDLFRVHLYRSGIKAMIRDLLIFRKKYMKAKKFREFSGSHLNLTSIKYTDNEDLRDLEQQYDAFICGSDQIWNTSCTQGVAPAYFLDFITDDTKRTIAYAPSLGRDEVRVDHLDEFRTLVSRIEHVSVREKRNVDYVERMINRGVQSVLDPTLLLTREQWDDLLLHEKVESRERYILVYMLEKNGGLIQYANELSNEKQMRLVHFNFLNPGFHNSENRSIASPIGYLRLIRDADYVITNSFHATVFSVIFAKQFVTFAHTKSYARMVDLLQTLGIRERLYNDNFCIDAKIDYESVVDILTSERQKSIEFLIRGLS